MALNYNNADTHFTKYVKALNNNWDICDYNLAIVSSNIIKMILKSGLTV